MHDLTTIVGDGQMGLVLAQMLAEHGRPVRLTGPFPEQVASLAISRRSPRLADLDLPGAVDVVADVRRAIDGAAILVNAIPSQFVRRVWSGLTIPARRDIVIVNVAKGVEVGTLKRPSQVLDEATGGAAGRRPIVTLSGPTIAAELARRKPATMVAASTDDGAAELAQRTFSGRWLRIYTNGDLVGVELAGACKNVIALAAGMIDGLEAGCNAKSALLARGLAELVRLGAAMGARPETFFGIAGVGDLATTCFSPDGRNRSCGERLGRGERLDDILRGATSVVEGIETAKAVVSLAAAHGVDMPIVRAVHAILFEGMAPAEAIESLMGRALKAEQVG